jgi:ABC-2 type transport system permease protein
MSTPNVQLPTPKLVPRAVVALLKLTWLEIKIFVREPMGVIGTIGIPVVVFLIASRLLGPRIARTAIQTGGGPGSAVLPVLASILMALSAISSLVTIISIYREGGILKRLRATPLSPTVILSAHVLVKLIFTILTLAIMVLLGRRYFPPGAPVPLFSYAVALTFTTWAILSIGFFIASIVPTARFAQPLAAIILYPMIVVSGLFFPVSVLPQWMQVAARALPLGYAVSLLDGIWRGQGWAAHVGDVAALTLFFLAFTAISSRMFRWE